jgi:hypothetical protein
MTMRYATHPVTAAAALFCALWLLGSSAAGARTPESDLLRAPDRAQVAPNAAQNEADWAALEAERRATDGDYDGAVQAQQQAERDQRAADRLRGDQQTGR